MRCNECQAEVPDHAARCRGCGTPRGAPASSAPAPSPAAAPASHGLDPSQLPEVRADGTLRCLCCGRTTSVTAAGRCVLCGEQTARVLPPSAGSKFVSRLNAPVFGHGATGQVISTVVVGLLVVLGIAGKIARLKRSTGGPSQSQQEWAAARERDRAARTMYRPQPQYQPTYNQPTSYGGGYEYDAGGYDAGGYDSGGYDSGGDW